MIDISSSNLNICSLQLTITAKKIFCEITVYYFETPKFGPKPEKFLITFDLMNRNENSKNLPPFYLFKPNILLQLNDSNHQAALQLEEFFINMDTVYKISEPYGGDQMMKHPKPKKPQFNNYHQMVATVLTFDNSMTLMEQMKSEIKKISNCIVSDAFQVMHIDMCKMMMSAKNG